MIYRSWMYEQNIYGMWLVGRLRPNMPMYDADSTQHKTTEEEAFAVLVARVNIARADLGRRRK